MFKANNWNWNGNWLFLLWKCSSMVITTSIHTFVMMFCFELVQWLGTKKTVDLLFFLHAYQCCKNGQRWRWSFNVSLNVIRILFTELFSSLRTPTVPQKHSKISLQITSLYWSHHSIIIWKISLNNRFLLYITGCVRSTD